MVIKTVWDNIVYIFDLVGHSKATQCYAWASPIKGLTRYTYLYRSADSPIDSPEQAIRASIAQKSRNRYNEMMGENHEQTLRRGGCVLDKAFSRETQPTLLHDFISAKQILACMFLLERAAYRNTTSSGYASYRRIHTRETLHLYTRGRRSACLYSHHYGTASAAEVSRSCRCLLMRRLSRPQLNPTISALLP